MINISIKKGIDCSIAGAKMAAGEISQRHPYIREASVRGKGKRRWWNVAGKVRRWERSTVCGKGMMREAGTGRGKECGKYAGEREEVGRKKRTEIYWKPKPKDSEYGAQKFVAGKYVGFEVCGWEWLWKGDLPLGGYGAGGGLSHVVFVLAGMTAHGPVGVRD